jgi:serine/threonine-protein kinase
VAFDRRDRSRKNLVHGVFARYSPTGHLLWVTADGALNAQRFDPDRLTLIGTPVTLWTGVGLWAFGATDLALSRRGDLLYAPGGARSAFAELVWVARDGRSTPVDSTMVDGLINDMALSPSGSAVALELLRPSDASGLSRIWVKRLGGGPTQLVTTDSVSSRKPVWSRDSRDLFYLSRAGTAIMRRPADGSGVASRVGTLTQQATDFTLHPDQTTVVFRAEQTGARQRSLSHHRLGSDTTITLPFAVTGQSTPRFSPDGSWLAYVSAESGREEVYVRPWPGADARKVQVSVVGGRQPRWNPAGRELFYLGAGGQMMSASVTTGPSLAVTARTPLFTPVGFQGTTQGLLYEPSPDGRRFLMLSLAGAGGSAAREEAVMVQNFDTELLRRLPR